MLEIPTLTPLNEVEPLDPVGEVDDASPETPQPPPVEASPAEPVILPDMPAAGQGGHSHSEHRDEEKIQSLIARFKRMSTAELEENEPDISGKAQQFQNQENVVEPELQKEEDVLRNELGIEIPIRKKRREKMAPIRPVEDEHLAWRNVYRERIRQVAKKGEDITQRMDEFLFEDIVHNDWEKSLMFEFYLEERGFCGKLQEALKQLEVNPRLLHHVDHIDTVKARNMFGKFYDNLPPEVQRTVKEAGPVLVTAIALGAFMATPASLIAAVGGLAGGYIGRKIARRKYLEPVLRLKEGEVLEDPDKPAEKASSDAHGGHDAHAHGGHDEHDAHGHGGHDGKPEKVVKKEEHHAAAPAHPEGPLEDERFLGLNYRLATKLVKDGMAMQARAREIYDARKKDEISTHSEHEHAAKETILQQIIDHTDRTVHAEAAQYLGARQSYEKAAKRNAFFGRIIGGGVGSALGMWASAVDASAHGVYMVTNADHSLTVVNKILTGDHGHLVKNIHTKAGDMWNFIVKPQDIQAPFIGPNTINHIYDSLGNLVDVNQAVLTGNNELQRHVADGLMSHVMSDTAGFSAIPGVLLQSAVEGGLVTAATTAAGFIRDWFSEKASRPRKTDQITPLQTVLHGALGLAGSHASSGYGWGSGFDRSTSEAKPQTAPTPTEVTGQETHHTADHAADNDANPAENPNPDIASQTVTSTAEESPNPIKPDETILSKMDDAGFLSALESELDTAVPSRVLEIQSLLEEEVKKSEGSSERLPYVEHLKTKANSWLSSINNGKKPHIFHCSVDITKKEELTGLKRRIDASKVNTDGNMLLSVSILPKTMELDSNRLEAKESELRKKLGLNGSDSDIVLGAPTKVLSSSFTKAYMHATAKILSTDTNSVDFAELPG